MMNEKEEKSINLRVWSTINVLLPVPAFVLSGLFESWGFFTFVTDGGIVRPERKWVSDLLMFPLYITSIGVLISCAAAIIFSIKKRKDSNAANCIVLSAAGFFIEILLWCGMLYIGSNF